MLYKIIITKDGKKKKVLYEGSNEDTAKEKYFKTKDKNIVLFPKKNNAYKKVKPVHYEIMFLKEKEDSDSPFYVRDELGRNKPVDIKSDKWSLVHKDDFFYEEKSYWIITDNINPLDIETSKLHNIIHEQQYKIMMKLGYKKTDYKYRYNQNIVQLCDFVFRNPLGKRKCELKYIINEQDYLLSILCI